MNLGILAKRAGRLASDNSPAILTAIGVTGAVVTAYLAGTASYKAFDVIQQAEEKRNIDALHDIDVYPLEFKDKLELTWKLYVPAAASAALTVAAIICANRVGVRRTAALASAYSLSEKAYTEYKGKVLEKLGEKKEKTVRDEIAQDRVKNNVVGSREIIVANGDVRCFDTFTGRYFSSSVNALQAAKNDINSQINNNIYASLTEFYHLVGLSPTAMSDEVGWNSDKLLDLDISSTLSEDGQPCVAVGFAVVPVRNYSNFH
jgi:Family of unknown function (DUF6353)